MVAASRQSLHPARPDIHFSLLDVSYLPFPADSFDVVIANHMLYHVPNRVQALANIRRVLRPGGRLYAATNGQRHLAELYAWVARAFGLDTGEEIRLSHSGTLSFNLENGADQLRASFKKVELRRYQDALAITAVEPLIEYTLTMMGDLPSLLDKNGIQKLRDLWQQELQENGVIHISKDTGLFIAS
jgi:ubiquinone/menaquinone biosynthesis C-methylase UbiE